MPVNEYLPWAVGTGSNVENHTTFAADPDLSLGFESGQARSAPANTLWRQHSVAVAALAQLICNSQGVDMHDDGSVATFLTNLQNMIASVGGAGASVGTASDLWVGTNNTKFATALALANAMLPQTLTDASSIAWNMALGGNAEVTIGGNRTLAQPTGLLKRSTGSLHVIQDATGSRLLSYAACFDFRSAGVPTLSTTGGKRDILYYEVVDPVAPLIVISPSLSA
ncbi:MAG: hypothetical protein JWQ97_303 [Phenylobacterium sp.]|nr:hypothetical protein [Phenylobacterium sp.]